MDISYNLALEIFGLEEPISRNDVNKAYKRLAKCSHPDKGGDAKLFCLITECKNILINDRPSITLKKTSSSAHNDTDFEPKEDAAINLYTVYYRSYYHLYHLEEQYKITDIVMKTQLRIYPIHKKQLEKIIDIIAVAKYSDFKKFGYVPLTCYVDLPKEFEEYNKFVIQFEFLDTTFKTKATVNSPVSIKLSKIRFNTLLELMLTKSTG